MTFRLFSTLPSPKGILLFQNSYTISIEVFVAQMTQLPSICPIKHMSDQCLTVSKVSYILLNTEYTFQKSPYKNTFII